MKNIRTLLVDDQALFREGLRTLLSVQPDIQVVGEAANGLEAIECAEKEQPDVVLMDLRMPLLNGVEATRRIHSTNKTCKIIVLTTFDDDEDVFEALRAGASGYMLKDAPSEKLSEAIRAAARGDSFLEPSVAAKVVAEFHRMSNHQRATVSPLVETLSEREREVLQNLAQGKSNKEIATALGVAEGTVKNHMTNILGKLGVLDRTQAALKAKDLGLI
jgi:RNA polymerase sigma factor (sigma-70 family)